MSDEPDIGVAAVDVADLQPWLAGERSLSELTTHYPFLRTEDQAQRFLASVAEGLADVRAGRTVPHEQILRDVEDRRRRFGLSAAE